MCVQIYIFKCEWSNARIVVVWICPIDFAASTVLCPGNEPNITVRIKLKTIPYVSRQRCMCRTGFRLQADGLTCKDVDECGEGSRPACAHLCLNSRGSFLCQCHPGFLLEADGRTCKTPGVCVRGREICSPNSKCLLFVLVCFSGVGYISAMHNYCFSIFQFEVMWPEIVGDRRIPQGPLLMSIVSVWVY